MEDVVHLVVSGHYFQIDKDLKERLPKEQAIRKISNGSFQQLHFIYHKNRETFEKVLNHFQGSNLHMPLSVCPAEFIEDLRYWGARPEALSPCCYVRYKHYQNERMLVNALTTTNDKKKKCYASKLQEVRALIWNIVNSRNSSVLCKIYFIMSTLFILMSIFAIAGSTLPMFREEKNITIEGNVTEDIDDGLTTTTTGDLQRLTTTTTEDLQRLTTMNIEDHGNATAAILNFTLQRPTLDFAKIYIIGNTKTLSKFITIRHNFEKLSGYNYVEYILNAFFAFDILCRILCAPNCKSFFIDFVNLTDLIITMCAFTRYFLRFRHLYTPENGEDALLYVQIFRVLRLFRVMQKLTAFKVLCLTLKFCKKDLLALFLYMSGVVLMLSNFLYFTESEDDFPSIPDTWWFSIVSMTTLGYGDMVPKTIVGKAIASLCTILGLLLFSMIVPIVASTFMTVYSCSKLKEDEPNTGVLNEDITRYSTDRNAQSQRTDHDKI